MKRIKNILLLIAVIIVGGVIGIKASTLIQSSQVVYKENKTVDVVLDEMINELGVGKEKIAEAITTKGITTTGDNTLEEMATNIANISSGNSNLRYNEETGYVQVLDTNGNWINIYATNQLPISAILPLVPTLKSNNSNIVSSFIYSAYAMFDGDDTTASADTDTSTTLAQSNHTSYAGYTFNNATVKYAEVLAYNPDTDTDSRYAYIYPKVKLQYSDNKTNWIDASIVVTLKATETNPTITTLESTEVNPHKYWRIYFDGCTSRLTYSGYRYHTHVQMIQFYGVDAIS